MYATLTIEAIDFEQELIFTPEERYAQLTLYVQQLQLSVESNLSTVVAEFFLGNYLKGVGISSIVKTSSVCLVDTYTITFTDNTTTTFDVTNGKDGADGIGISNIELVSTVGKVKTYRITFTNSSTFEYTITDGVDGRGIVSIIKTSTVGLVDTYTITYSDATTSTFDVTNGTNGEMNVIEEVQVNSVPLEITDKSVNVIVPTQPSDIGAEPANSNIQSHISDTNIHIDSSSELGEAINESTHSLLLWNGLKALKVTFARLKTWIGSYFLKLDQSTPQTLTDSPIISTLVKGRIPYIAANKQLQSIWGAFFYNTATAKGGIGTETPATVFDVVGGTSGVETDILCIRSQATGAGTATTLRIVNSTNAADNASSGEISVKRESLGAVMSLRIGSNSVMKELVTLLHTSNFVGIDTIAPKSKLQVNGGIQCGDDTAAASADKVGTIRQRDVDNKTKLEFVRNNNGTYEWEQINDKLSLDQSTPQTINGNVNINGSVNPVTTDVNQSTIPSVNASQTAAILQDGSSFTGTDYVMPTNNVAVKIVASAAHTMGDFTIRVKSSATLTSNIAILKGYLYSDNAGSPGTLLATGNAILHDSITTSYQELSLGTQYNMVAGTTYWLVVRWSAAPTGGNIILDSNVSSNLGATSADATTWTLTNVQLRYRLRGRTYYGINAFSTNYIGVRGMSTNNYGIYGESSNNIGVYGNSANSIGVYGNSTNSIGVYGASTNNYGVRGASTNSYGVVGTSTNNYGIYGESSNNIGVYGNSTNSIGVYGSSTNNFGVVGESTNNYSGFFIRNTQTPTSSVSVLYAYQQHASNTNSVIDIRQNGTGEIIRGFSNTTQTFSVTASGLGMFAKGVQIGDNTDAASSANKGILRYRENAGGSFFEICMKQTNGSYAWQSIVFNQ